MRVRSTAFAFLHHPYGNNEPQGTKHNHAPATARSTPYSLVPPVRLFIILAARRQAAEASRKFHRIVSGKFPTGQKEVKGKRPTVDTRAWATSGRQKGVCWRIGCFRKQQQNIKRITLAWCVRCSSAHHAFAHAGISFCAIIFTYPILR